MIVPTADGIPSLVDAFIGGGLSSGRPIVICKIEAKTHWKKKNMEILNEAERELVHIKVIDKYQFEWRYCRQNRTDRGEWTVWGWSTERWVINYKKGQQAYEKSIRKEHDGIERRGISKVLFGDTQPLSTSRHGKSTRLLCPFQQEIIKRLTRQHDTLYSIRLHSRKQTDLANDMRILSEIEIDESSVFDLALEVSISWDTLHGLDDE